jgi:hypothetical protein
MEWLLNGFINLARVILVFILVAGIMIYALMMLRYALIGPVKRQKTLLASAPPVYMFALPISAVTAFGVVALLMTLATGKPSYENTRSADAASAVSPPAQPANKDKDKEKDAEKLTFKAFNLEFSGPAGPVTLWIVIYLTLVASIRIVDPKEKPEKDPKGKPEKP